MMTTAIEDYLLPYQHRWLADYAQHKTMLKSRQIGATDVGQALEAVIEALDFPHDQVVLSYRLETAKEVLRDCAKWIEVFDTLGLGIKAVVTKTVIEFPNGSRIRALPGTPEAARGARGTVRIDEAAFLRNATEVYSAVNPLLGSDARYRMVMTSTPMGETGLFHDACTGKIPGWSVHTVNIYDAVGDGLPRNIEALRLSSLNFEREYMCQWAAGGLYFTQDFLLDAFGEDAPKPPESHAPYGIVLAVDLAKIQDNTEMVAIVEAPVPYVMGHWVMRSLNYRDQRHIITSLAEELGAARVVVDETKHPGTTDELRRDLGTSRVVGRIITNKWKNRAFPGLRKAFETKRLKIDYDASHEWRGGGWHKVRSRPLLTQLLQVEQKITPGGSITYDVRRQDGQGHGDGVSALTLGHDLIAAHRHSPKLTIGIARRG
jgi:phage FluMu gp28-like protein